jgi:hypothetical protein
VVRTPVFVFFVSLAVLRSPSRVCGTTSPDVLRATGALPAHIADSFQDPAAYTQGDDGTYFVFDRRAHAVYSIAGGLVKKIVQIGAEPGHIIDPTAFALDPTGDTFVVADAPLRRQRIQIFNADGGRIGGFTLPDREVARVTFEGTVLNGIGAVQFSGRGVLINQPETGGLVDEFDFYGRTLHAFGNLRPTGHEGDRDLHLAFNSGFPLVDPNGGFFFVFNTGAPLFRKYDANGVFLFERHIEGPELDDYVRSMPAVWPKRTTADGDLLPFVPPAIRTAGVDRQGRLWVALMQPYTYVYDAHGEKIRTVQFKGAAIVAPNSLFFTKDGRVLVSPGCYEFKP